MCSPDGRHTWQAVNKFGSRREFQKISVDSGRWLWGVLRKWCAGESCAGRATHPGIFSDRQFFTCIDRIRAIASHISVRWMPFSASANCVSISPYGTPVS